MKIALHSDRTRFPNLALLKLSAWHKAQGDDVSAYHPLFQYDRVYSAKVFSWTPADPYLPHDAIKGGTGYGIYKDLPDEIEHICPDYTGMNHSLGFLTRGCIRSCPWCVVPAKEGAVRAHADIEEFCRHRDVVLMDNNVLADPHGIAQIEKMVRLGLRVDFNQGLDARLIDAAIARRLAALRWIRFIRLACDHTSQMPYIRRTVALLRAAGCRKELACYVLVRDIPDALERIEFLRALDVTPFAQPYRDPHSAQMPTPLQRNFSRWVNHKAIFKSVPWHEYKGAA